MRPMSPDEVVEFMTTGSRTGKLALTRKDGSPTVTPIWFDVDPANGDFVFMTGAESAKAKMLRREPRVSICVDVMEMPFDFARMDGVAAITTYDEDPKAIRHWATVTCRRFVGDDRAEEFGARNGGADEILVRVTPTKLIGGFGVSD
ncbi:MAG: PPOX class F420-dependent oxidoreductase [Actinomycetota bacterium]